MQDGGAPQPRDLLAARSDRLHQLTRIDDRLSLAIILADYAAVIAITAIAITLHHPLITLCAIVLVAGRQVAFLNLVHAAAHYSLFSNRTANNKVDLLVAYPIFDSVRPYRSYHLQHHRDIARKSADRFDYLYDQLPEADASWLRRTWAVIVKPLAGAAAIDFVRATLDSMRENRRLGLKLSSYWLLVIAALWRAGGLEYLLVYWFIPLIWLYPVFYFWAEISDHYAVHEEARNQRGMFYSLFIKGHEMYHAVHHLHPRIPFYRIRAASRYLRSIGEEIEESRGLVDFLKILYRPKPATAIAEDPAA